MYTGLLHTHRLAVILFLVLYVFKLVLLLAGPGERLARLTKLTRIPEMIISFLFLATGAGLLAMVAKITPMLLIKIALVLASIPIAVIGFRKSNKLLASLSVVLIIASYGLAEANKIGVDHDPLPASVITDAAAPGYDAQAHGAAVYARNCVVCHGPNGDSGKSGSKNLRQTQLTEAQQRELMLAGKNAMPSYAKVLDAAEITAVLAYIKTLHD
ncbi:MAG: c-type cytochrome [Bacteroidia bacterium]|nr:c-type cytochrome [Bacteroidia bacterium]